MDTRCLVLILPAVACGFIGCSRSEQNCPDPGCRAVCPDCLVTTSCPDPDLVPVDGVVSAADETTADEGIVNPNEDDAGSYESVPSEDEAGPEGPDAQEAFSWSDAFASDSMDGWDGVADASPQPAIELVLDLCGGMQGEPGKAIPPDRICLINPQGPDYPSPSHPEPKLDGSWLYGPFWIRPAAFLHFPYAFCAPPFRVEVEMFLDDKPIYRLSRLSQIYCISEPTDHACEQDVQVNQEDWRWLSLFYGEALGPPRIEYELDEIAYGSHRVKMIVKVPDLGLSGETSATFFVSRCRQQCIAWGDWEQRAEVPLGEGDETMFPFGLTIYPDEPNGVGIVVTGRVWQQDWPFQTNAGFTALVRGAEDEWEAFITKTPAEANSIDECDKAMPQSVRQRFWYSPRSGNVFLITDSLHSTKPGGPAIRMGIWNPVAGVMEQKDLVVNDEYLIPKTDHVFLDYSAMFGGSSADRFYVFAMVSGWNDYGENQEFWPFALLWTLDDQGGIIEETKYDLESISFPLTFEECNNALFERDEIGILHGATRNSMTAFAPFYFNTLDGVLRTRQGIPGFQYSPFMLKLDRNLPVIYSQGYLSDVAKFTLLPDGSHTDYQTIGDILSSKNDELSELFVADITSLPAPIVPALDAQYDSCGREWVVLVPNRAIFLTENPYGEYRSSLVQVIPESAEYLSGLIMIPELPVSLALDNDDNLYLAYRVGYTGTIRILERPCIEYADAALWQYPVPK